MKLKKCKCHRCILQRRIQKILKKHKIFHELESFDFSFYPEFQSINIRLAEIFGELDVIYAHLRSKPLKSRISSFIHIKARKSTLGSVRRPNGERGSR